MSALKKQNNAIFRIGVLQRKLKTLQPKFAQFQSYYYSVPEHHFPFEPNPHLKPNRSRQSAYAEAAPLSQGGD